MLDFKDAARNNAVQNVSAPCVSSSSPKSQEKRLVVIRIFVKRKKLFYILLCNSLFERTKIHASYAIISSSLKVFLQAQNNTAFMATKLFA